MNFFKLPFISLLFLLSTPTTASDFDNGKVFRSEDDFYSIFEPNALCFDQSVYGRATFEGDPVIGYIDPVFCSPSTITGSFKLDNGDITCVGLVYIRPTYDVYVVEWHLSNPSTCGTIKPLWNTVIQ